MSSPKHILFLATWYPSAVSPTLGNFIQRQAHLVAENIRVTVIALISRKNQVFPTAPRVKFVHDQLTEIRAYYPAWMGNTGRMHALKRAMRTLDGFQPGPDLIHANILYFCKPELQWLKERTGLPVVLTEHWSGFLPERPFQWSGSAIEHIQNQAQMVDHLLPVTQNLEHAMRNKGIAVPMTVVRNHVAEAFFETTVTPSPGRPHLLHLSTLDANKNPQAIIEVAEMLTEEGLDFELTIAGDGNIEPLERYTRLRGLDPQRFHFLQDLSQDEVVKVMEGKTALVLFSGYENLPCVIGEAQACGLPIISTDVGGIREVVGFNEGILLSAGDREGLASAMRRVILDFSPNRAAIRQHARDHFSPSTIKSALLKIYENTLMA